MLTVLREFIQRLRTEVNALSIIPRQTRICIPCSKSFLFYSREPMAKNIYLQHTTTPKHTPQSQAIPDTDQVQNNAGGFVWAIDDWKRLERFLILGSESGSYYTSEKKLTVDNAQAAKRCIVADGLRVVSMVVDVSDRGRAIKNDPALFVLAMAAAAPDESVRRAALSALEKVARTGTHLFTFLEMVQAFRGWGRALSRAVGNWYNNKTVDNAAYQMVKYRQRNGWTHRDVLRLKAMLPTMPLTALIRNLGTMGSVGLLVPNHSSIQTVVSRLTDADYLRKSRVHPLTILVALKTYEQGKGTLGDNKWPVVPQVVDALNTAFYASFENVEPTGKRFLLGIDVSASMEQAISGVPSISCSQAAAVLAMVTMRTEQNYVVMAFDQGMRDVGLTAGQNLSEVHRRIDSLNGGGTDCSLPMVYALEHRILVDVFVVLTDNETWAGHMHPVQALKEYREKMGIPAKLVVVGMVASEISIADPKDAGMLDVCGMDTSVPQALAEFAKM